MTAVLELAIILFLIVINGVFAMSELALVSVRRARLSVLERKGVAGAKAALTLAEDPQRFLPTVQVGVTLVSVIAGTVGGARLAAQLQPVLAKLPYMAHAAEGVSLTIVVLGITYATMVLGELVPKQLALRRPELVAIQLARPVAFLARIMTPMVWLLGLSSHLVLRLLGQSDMSRQAVTE